MNITIEDLMKLVNKLTTRELIILVSSLLVLTFLCFLLIKKTESLINQHLTSYETKFQKLNEVIFNNIEISNELKIETIRYGNNIRLDLFQSLYQLFFNIQYNYQKLNDYNLFSEYSNILHDLRVKIFINSIYLDELFDLYMEIYCNLETIFHCGYLNAQGKQYNENENIKAWTAFHNNIKNLQLSLRDKLRSYLDLSDVDFEKELSENMKSISMDYIKNNLQELS